MNKGTSIIGILILLVIIIFGMMFGIKWILVKVKFYALKDKVEEVIRFAQTKDDNEITKEIMDKAREQNIEIEPDSFYIDREPGDHITITLSYNDSIVIPKKTLYFHFRLERTGPLEE